jgi:hypothetical protein
MGIPCYYDDDEGEEDLLQNLNDIHQGLFHEVTMV